MLLIHQITKSKNITPIPAIIGLRSQIPRAVRPNPMNANNALNMKKGRTCYLKRFTFVPIKLLHYKMVKITLVIFLEDSNKYSLKNEKITHMRWRNQVLALQSSYMCTILPDKPSIQIDTVCTLLRLCCTHDEPCTLLVVAHNIGEPSSFKKRFKLLPKETFNPCSLVIPVSEFPSKCS